MKLLLGSWTPSMHEKLGTTFLKLLTKPPNENKLLILSMDTTSDIHVKLLKDETTWYKSKGFKDDNIQITNLQSDPVPDLDNLDVLHMWGGNEFGYLKRIKDIGLFDRIHEYIQRDGVYVGSSAGSMLMSAELDENLSGDKNEVGLEDVRGFGYIDFNLLVHWDTAYSGKHADWLRYSWEKGRKVVCLTDNQAILVTDQGFEIISP